MKFVTRYTRRVFSQTTTTESSKFRNRSYDVTPTTLRRYGGRLLESFTLIRRPLQTTYVCVCNSVVV